MYEVKESLKRIKYTLETIKIKIDNIAVIYNSENEIIKQRSKHINLRYHKDKKLKISLFIGNVILVLEVLIVYVLVLFEHMVQILLLF